MRIFISHSSSDKRFVRTLKADLTENGLNTWVDEDELQLGDTLVEKLEQAINDSSHFLIVLSPSSVESDWVRLELNKAKLLKDQSILKKLIPIRYRECEIPESLKGDIYADLANEIVQTENDKIKFVSDGYSGFLKKLVNTIRNSDKTLNDSDKSKLLKEIKSIEQEEEKVSVNIGSIELKKITSISLLLKVIRFKNKSTLGLYTQFIKEKTENQETKNKSVNQILPLILPTTIKLLEGDLGLGDEILVRYKGNEIKGHFSGYRRKLETYSITIPGQIRRLTGIVDRNIYLFEFDTQKKTITISDL